MNKHHFDAVTDSWRFEFTATVDGEERPVPDVVSHCACIVDPADACLTHAALRLNLDVRDELILTATGGVLLSYRRGGDGRKLLEFKNEFDPGADPRRYRQRLELARGEVVHLWLRFPEDGVH